MWTHEASVEIDAVPAAVWAVLVDIDSYPSWNRYASRATGDLQVGGRVRIVVPQWKGRRGEVNNQVTEIVENERLCWRSLSWYRPLVYGIRCRILEPQSGGTTLFREVETMHGALSGLIRRTMSVQLLAGLQDECDSLRDEVGRRGGRGSGQI